ncbi:hypothetical protein BSKO_12292 [Bryopsis sp. KO-2023]|nr:hypothetical protein BSKO_12292 [Bryopsis sp. KO-2023]
MRSLKPTLCALLLGACLLVIAGEDARSDQQKSFGLSGGLEATAVNSRSLTQRGGVARRAGRGTVPGRAAFGANQSPPPPPLTSRLGSNETGPGQNGFRQNLTGAGRTGETALEGYGSPTLHKEYR